MYVCVYIYIYIIRIIYTHTYRYNNTAARPPGVPRGAEALRRGPMAQPQSQSASNSILHYSSVIVHVMI